MKKLFRAVPAARLLLAASVGLGLCGSALILLEALWIARVTDRAFLGGETLGRLMPALLVLAGWIAGRVLLQIASDWLALRLASRVKEELRSRIVQKTLELGPYAVRKERSGELLTVLVEGVEQLETFLARYLPQVALSVMVPLAVAVAVLRLDVTSAVVLGVTMPLLILFMILIGIGTKAKTEKQLKALGLLGGHFHDVVRGLPTLVMFNRGKAQVDIIRRIGEEHRRTTMGTLRLAFLSGLVMELFATLSTAVVAVFLGLRLVNGDIGFEAAYAVLLLTPEFYLPVRAVGNQFHSGMNGRVAAERILAYLEQEPPGYGEGGRKLEGLELECGEGGRRVVRGPLEAEAVRCGEVSRIAAGEPLEHGEGGRRLSDEEQECGEGGRRVSAEAQECGEGGRSPCVARFEIRLEGVTVELAGAQDTESCGPTAVEYQSTAVERQPTAAVHRPTTDEYQPDTVERQHTTIENQHTTVENQHTTVENQHTTVENQHATATHQPIVASVERAALSEVTLTVRPGETVALVGHTGAGKSTLLDLVQGFVRPTAGTVRVNGVDLAELSISWWRSQLAVVSQDTRLFRGSILDNLRLGRADAPLEDVIEAARQARADGFIRELPLGYDTPVSEAVQLSGGQLQRLAIARALVRNAPVVLLDEPTSSLDMENEALVQEALVELCAGRTVLMAAHRLDTVRGADRLVVLRHGRIVEQGRPSELLPAEGAYTELVRAGAGV